MGERIKMEKLNKKDLAMFLGNGDTLETWDDMGFLKREMALYNLLAEKFNKIYIFTYGSQKDKEYQRILKKNVVIIPKTSKLNNEIYELLIPFKFSHLLRRCDIYKTNQNIAATAPTLCKLLYGNKLVIRSGFIGSVNAKLYKCSFYIRAHVFLVEFLSYLFCNRAFIPTEQNYDILIKKYPFLKGKLMIMNNFTDTNLFIKKNSIKKYDIVYVARLDKDKNHLELLKAIKGLGLKVCFIGQGKEEENIRNFARASNIILKMIKRVPNEKLPEYYNSTNIYVFPSLHEGNPKTLLEAMSCELPVIGCNVTGVSNLIKNQQNGLLCEPTAESLRKTIQYLFKNKKLWGKLGKNAREMIINEFSLDSLVIRELEEYVKMIK